VRGPAWRPRAQPHAHRAARPASIHHGDADTTVPPQHARLFAAAIPGAQLQLHPGHGHFSILGTAGQMLAALAA
jgi:pimeloyl-ACP methyl ester carboxylesterase